MTQLPVTVDVYAVTIGVSRTMHTAQSARAAVAKARFYLFDQKTPVAKVERLIERADSARWIEVVFAPCCGAANTVTEQGDCLSCGSYTAAEVAR